MNASMCVSEKMLHSSYHKQTDITEYISYCTHVSNATYIHRGPYICQQCNMLVPESWNTWLAVKVVWTRTSWSILLALVLGCRVNKDQKGITDTFLQELSLVLRQSLWSHSEVSLCVLYGKHWVYTTLLYYSSPLNYQTVSWHTQSKSSDSDKKQGKNN